MKIKNFKCYKRMLIITDMTNGFVRYGDLHDPKIGEIISYQLELIQEAVKDDDTLIVFIKDTHTLDSVEHRRFGGLLHGIVGSGEEELIDELKPYEPYGISYEKNSTSFMFAPGFMPMLDKMSNLERIDVLGCCTDICIANGVIPMANYFDQYNRLVDIYVHERGIETYHSPVHDREEYAGYAKVLMRQQGIKMVA